MNESNRKMVEEAIEIMREYYDKSPYGEVKQWIGQVLEYCTDLKNLADEFTSDFKSGGQDIIYQMIFINLHMVTAILNFDIGESLFLVQHAIDYQNNLRSKVDANSTSSTNSSS